jgi:putative inorganic carbon (HCO3(-)) transporter
MTAIRSHTFNSSVSVFHALTSAEPYQYLLFFLFIQPFLGFTRNEELDLAKHVFQRAFALSLMMYTLFYLSHHHGSLLFPSIHVERSLLLYAVGVFIPTLIAMVQNKTQTGRTITSLLTVPMLMSLWFTCSYWLDDLKKIVYALKSFVYSVVVVCIIGIIEFISIFISEGFGGDRIRSVFVDPNIFARYVLLGIFFLVPLVTFKDERVFRRRTMLLMLALFLVNLLLSLSRSGYLTLIVGGIVFSLFLGNRRIRSLIIGGSITIGVVIFVYLFTLRSFSGSAVIEPSNINRVQLILGGIDMIRSDGLLGIGYTNFANYYEKNYLENTLSISPEDYKYAGFATEIHNWVIEVWAEQGIFGLIIFIMVFTKVFILLNRSVKKTADGTLRYILMGSTMLFFVFLFHGFFYHTFISQFFFWTVSGISVAAIRFALNEDKSS